ncbi:hypothetical protein YC2023_027092 [Brassica napus]
MRLAPHISSSGSLLRTPQETPLVPPRLLFCLLRLQESSWHPIDFSRKPFLVSFSEASKMYEKIQVIGYIACLLVDDFERIGNVMCIYRKINE